MFQVTREDIAKEQVRGENSQEETEVPEGSYYVDFSYGYYDKDSGLIVDNAHSKEVREKLKGRLVPYETVCKIYKTNGELPNPEKDNPIAIGVSKVVPPDNFSRTTGRKIALSKAFKIIETVQTARKGHYIKKERVNPELSNIKLRKAIWRAYLNKSTYQTSPIAILKDKLTKATTRIEQLEKLCNARSGVLED